MKLSFLLFIIIIHFSPVLYGQRMSWYFPEYKHYLRPDNDCNEKSVVSIWGWQYLKIKVKDSCRLVEISCYRSKDSTLKEKGLYYNTSDTITQNAIVGQAGTDSVRTTKSRQIVFKRTGTWRFYNKAGRIIKTVKYKKPEG